MKVLISLKTGRTYYPKQEADYHCKEGVLKQEDVFGESSHIKSNLGVEFLVFDAQLADKSKNLRRAPQIITDKDLGYIVSRTRLNKNSHLLEAGAGSGAATSFFSSICDKVFAYEIREDHKEVVEKNLKFMNCDNVDLKVGDLADNVENHENIDVMFLDMPEPDKVLEKNLDCVKNGGFIVCYVPSITQVQNVIRVQSSRDDLYYEEISEVILRHWRVNERIARPEHRKEIDHTAFLIFLRKI